MVVIVGGILKDAICVFLFFCKLCCSCLLFVFVLFLFVFEMKMSACLSICLSVYCQPFVGFNFQEYSTDWLEEVTTSVGWRLLLVENGEQFAINIGTNARPLSFADSSTSLTAKPLDARILAVEVGRFGSVI